MNNMIRPLTLLLTLSMGGCYALDLQLVDASVQKPSNVAVYFSMDDKQGNPVPGVEAEQFKIYEDGQLISSYESKQTILNPEVAIERYTLLLLDMSGSVVDSGQVPVVQEAVGAFLENIGENEKVAIYAFDGREEIMPLAKFGMREEALSRRNELLTRYEPKDPSTNLNGAIVEATRVLKEEKDKSDVPLAFATLVVFTDGTDRAHRATEDDALQALDDNGVGSFVIGLGGESDVTQAERYGRDGFVHAEDTDKVVTSFKEVADKINAQALRYYLLSYCSPSRAGTHELTVEVEREDQKGKLTYQFDAEGFAPKCNPEDAPKFEIPDDEESNDTAEADQPRRRRLFARAQRGEDDENRSSRGDDPKAKKRKSKKKKHDRNKTAAPPPAGY